MKRVAGMLFLLLMLLLMALFTSAEEREEEEPHQEIITTKYLTDEDLSLLYTCKNDVRKSDPNIVELTQEEALLMMQIARSEGGETLKGQIWVMGVLINRINSDEFPNTLYEVVSQDNPVQFEVFDSGSYLVAPINVNSHLALAQIEMGENPTKGAIWFESSTNSDDSWQKTQEFVAEIEGNRYYK